MTENLPGQVRHRNGPEPGESWPAIHPAVEAGTEALAAHPTCPHVVMVTVVQSARCDDCTSGLVTQAVLRWAARERLPTGTDNILAWLRRRGPSRTPSPGYLLADVRATSCGSPTRSSGLEATVTTDQPRVPVEVLEEATLEAARAWCRTRFDYDGPYLAEDGAEQHLERDAARTAEDPALQSAVAFAAPILFAAGLDAGHTQAASLDSAMGSVWLHGNWRWLTENMTTPEKEAAADAVDRHGATWPPEDRGFPVERWWRDDA
jgi:hypothetical protein